MRPSARLAARWLVPVPPNVPVWRSHTLVETQRHQVDALTGADGCPSAEYLPRYWRHPEAIEVHEVDVALVDPWIQEQEQAP